jgi:hypothetical protein
VTPFFGSLWATAILRSIPTELYDEKLPRQILTILCLLLLLLQARDSPQGARQDTAQESSFDRVGVAWDWRPAKPRLAALCHSSVRKKQMRLSVF